MAISGSVSLADVARQSGVSPSTVSRVLNNHTDNFSVRTGTRDRILEVVRELNYRPDPITRAMRAKRTNLIAVLGMSDFGTAIRGTTEEAVNSLMETVFADGYELCTNILSPQEQAFMLPRWRVDGAVVVDCSDPAKLRSLDESDTPYVTINGPSGVRGSSVCVDDTTGARDAIMHLMMLGHKRIAYALPDKFSWHESLTSRHQAYQSTLEEFGLEVVTPEFEPGLSPLEVIRNCVIRGKATGILAYNHMMAVKLLRACSVHGIAVPRDLSMVCFNDLFPCADIVPSLTAMSLPGRKMGETAGNLILSLIRGEGDTPLPQHVKLHEDLIIRESTAPAPASA